MIFEKTQKVVCINATCKTYCRYPLKKGAIYTISGLYQCECGSLQVALVEYPEVLNMHCGCSRVSERRQTYYEWRFMPLDLFTNFIAIPEEKSVEEELTIEDPASCKEDNPKN